jgi:hypothetical protein
MIGVALNSAMTSPAMVAYSGKVLCSFENAITPGDYVIQGTGSFSKCRDAGSTYSAIPSVQGPLSTAPVTFCFA